MGKDPQPMVNRLSPGLQSPVPTPYLLYFRWEMVSCLSHHPLPTAVQDNPFLQRLISRNNGLGRAGSSLVIVVWLLVIVFLSGHWNLVIGHCL